MQSKLTQQQIEEIRARRDEGESLHALGKAYGVSYETIRLKVAPHGADIKALRKLRERWVSVDQLAAALGMSEVAVAYACERGEFPGAGRIGKVWLIPRRYLLKNGD